METQRTKILIMKITDEKVDVSKHATVRTCLTKKEQFRIVDKMKIDEWVKKVWWVCF